MLLEPESGKAVSLERGNTEPKEVPEKADLILKNIHTVEATAMCRGMSWKEWYFVKRRGSGVGQDKKSSPRGSLLKEVEEEGGAPRLAPGRAREGDRTSTFSCRITKSRE